MKKKDYTVAEIEKASILNIKLLLLQDIQRLFPFMIICTQKMILNN